MILSGDQYLKIGVIHEEAFLVPAFIIQFCK